MVSPGAVQPPPSDATAALSSRIYDFMYALAVYSDDTLSVSVKVQITKHDSI